MVCRERIKFTHSQKTNLRFIVNEQRLLIHEKSEPMVHRERMKFGHSRIMNLRFIAKEQNLLICEKQTYSSSRKSENYSITEDEFKNEVQKDFTYKIHSNIMNRVELS